MSAMRIGVLFCLFLSAVCLAGQPMASAEVTAETGPVNFHRRLVLLPGPAPYFGPRLDSHLDTARAPDTLPRRAGFPNPFLDRFLTSAGFTAATYSQWRKGLYLRSALRGDGRFYPNPGQESDEYYPYDSRAMKTIGEIAHWVVPIFIPLEDREALMPERFDPQPGRHAWPYR
jgi:hypothetical protein